MFARIWLLQQITNPPEPISNEMSTPRERPYTEKTQWKILVWKKQVPTTQKFAIIVGLEPTLNLNLHKNLQLPKTLGYMTSFEPGGFEPIITLRLERPT